MARSFLLAGPSGNAQVELDDANRQFGFFGEGDSGIWRQLPPYNRDMLPAGGGFWGTGHVSFGKTGTHRTIRLLKQGAKEKDPDLASWIAGEVGLGKISHSGDRIAVTQLPNHADPAKIWWGILVKASVSLAVGGAEGQLGAAWNLSTKQAFAFGVKIGKALYGYGVSGGVSLILFTGFKSPESIVGATSEGWDFAFTVGPRWGSWVKGLQEAGLLTKLPWGEVPKLPKAAKTIEEMAGAAGRLENLETWASYAKIVVSGLGLDTRQQSYTTFDIPPAGGGCEISVQYGWGQVAIVKRL